MPSLWSPPKAPRKRRVRKDSDHNDEKERRQVHVLGHRTIIDVRDHLAKDYGPMPDIVRNAWKSLALHTVFGADVGAAATHPFMDRFCVWLLRRYMDPRDIARRLSQTRVQYVADAEDMCVLYDVRYRDNPYVPTAVTREVTGRRHWTFDRRTLDLGRGLFVAAAFADDRVHRALAAVAEAGVPNEALSMEVLWTAAVYLEHVYTGADVACYLGNVPATTFEAVTLHANVAALARYIRVGAESMDFHRTISYHGYAGNNLTSVDLIGRVDVVIKTGRQLYFIRAAASGGAIVCLPSWVREATFAATMLHAQKETVFAVVVVNMLKGVAWKYMETMWPSLPPIVRRAIRPMYAWTAEELAAMTTALP